MELRTSSFPDVGVAGVVWLCACSVSWLAAVAVVAELALALRSPVHWLGQDEDAVGSVGLASRGCVSLGSQRFAPSGGVWGLGHTAHPGDDFE